MKSREVTAEEKRLWREATKRDKKFCAEAEEEISITETAPAKKPSATLPATKSSPGKRASHPPRVLSLREAKKQLKAYPEVEATLDLHGLTRSEAFAQLRDFIAISQRRHRRHLLVVTGKGTGGAGVLKHALPGWLSEPPLAAEIVAIAQAAPEKGGSGALHVIVRKR